jgi:FMN phosphatase YigB (HAD superfamily)
MSRLTGILEQYKAESWKIEHDSAMACYDFDDWLAFGLKCLEFIRDKEHRYHERLKTEKSGADPRGIEDIQELYEQWYSPCRHLLEELDRFEKEGYVVSNSDAFRAACMSSNIPGFEPQTLQSAAQRAHAGGVRFAKEIRDELQRRIRG